MGWLKARGRTAGLIAAAAGLVVFLALLPALHARLWAPPLERARRAAARGDWAQTVALADHRLAVDRDDPDALRLKARGLARLGRGREALAIDARLGAERLEADDLFLIGRTLLDDGRPVLGWSALEAASRLQPDHRETAAALADLHRRLESLGAIVAQVDHLALVPDGPALAELVLAVVSIDREPKPSDGSSTILDRLLLRDRRDLLAIASPSAARKLAARLLLEEGRTAEARAWLERDGGCDHDPEACWLLSRAELVAGDLEKAAADLERAGTYGQENPTAAEPSRYVGAKRCVPCHGAIARTQQASGHARTLAWGDGLESVPLPSGPVRDPEDPKVTHRFERNGRRIEVSARVGDQTVRALVDFALGSGRHGVTMLARDESGRHRSLRLSYYAGGPSWDLTSGFNPHPVDPRSFVGELLSETSFAGCVNCHTTRFTSERDRSGPEALDRGIGCERCHGPGDHHVRAIDAGFPQPAIARPRLATPAQRAALCAECHRASGEVPSSDPRFIRFQSTTLSYSRCVTESGGRLDCVSCHDPHKTVETNAAHYETRCLVCHGGAAASPPQRKERLPEPVAASTCPVNARADCLACHMPRVEVGPSTSFTDHHIRIHRPPARTKNGKPKIGE